MGTVVSKRRSGEVSESAAVKIRVVAAFQNNCKDNSRDKQGQQSSSSISEQLASADNLCRTKPTASIAKTKFPKGVYPQRESNACLLTEQDMHHDDNQIQPYRLNLGMLTSSGTQLCPPRSHDDELKGLPQTTTVIQLQSGNEDHLQAGYEVGKIPDDLGWLLQRGMNIDEIHKAATNIQKIVRGYQCRRKLAERKKSALKIQWQFRHWRSSSLLLLNKDGAANQMFVPAKSLVQSDQQAHVMQPTTTQLQSIHEDVSVTTTVSSTSAQQADKETTNLLTSDHNYISEQYKTNSDIAAALKEVLSMVVPGFPTDNPPSQNERKSNNWEDIGQTTREHLNSLCHSNLLNSARNNALTIGREQFKMYLEFQSEIDETMFLAQQKAELCLGEFYVPRKVLLISSRVPKVKLLQCAILPEVITFVYDFERATYLELISKIAAALDDYREGAKIKQLGVICKGGPGYLYLFANKPVTPVKLFKDHKMMTFWKVLGAMMSKLVPEETRLHFMESNVNGNKQGEKLLKDLEKFMYPSKVNVTCPLEMSPSGKEMITTYFHLPKYKLWKQKRYTKLRLY